MRLLLIGAPGAGKGTQATLIAERFHIAHISSGDLLRTHVEENTTIGRAAQEFLAKGDLVPDAIVMDMLRKPVVAASEAGGYVLDGFPRTVEQAEGRVRDRAGARRRGRGRDLPRGADRGADPPAARPWPRARTTPPR